VVNVGKVTVASKLEGSNLGLLFTFFVKCSLAIGDGWVNKCVFTRFNGLIEMLSNNLVSFLMMTHNLILQVLLVVTFLIILLVSVGSIFFSTGLFDPAH
jgi:hypothetical protein